MKYQITEIKNIINGNFLHENNTSTITQVCIDTRQISSANQSLFFCLVARNDGHQFIENAYQKGIRNFVVSTKIDTERYADANFILVDDTLHALQQLAIYHRQQFNIPVIGITGSNGKTIVKEWLYQLLSSDKQVVKSPKSYNSQIGVALSVLNMENEDEIAIFEAGISTVGEMDKLQKMIQPTIGILTNIGSAHDAGFSSREEKVEEKLKLFNSCETLISSDDFSLVYGAVGKMIKENPTIKSVSFGINVDSSIVIAFLEKSTTCTIYSIESSPYGSPFNFLSTKIRIPFTDAASIENCLHCITTLLWLGYSLENIQTKILSLRNLPMRLELKYGINNCTIIDDSYSADLHSLQIALDFLKQQDTNKKKTLIISEFEESGLPENVFIQKLQEFIVQYKFEKLIGVGKSFMRAIELLNGKVKEWYIFESTEKLLEQFSILKFENEFILLKGARKFEFEKITAQLIGQTHETVLEINLNALVNNLNVYRSFLQKNCGVIAMVKAFSYGSGNVEIASLLEKQHVSYLAVAYADEGVVLRKNSIQTPIMVMNPDAKDFDRMLEFKLEPEIYSLEILQKLIQFLSTKNIEIAAFPIHLKLETGMNRLGFPVDDIDELISILQQNQQLIIETVFSHLAGSEDAQFDDFTNQQIETFNELSQKIITAFKYPIKKHLLNSAGIFRFPNAQFDYVRLGIGLYGVDASNNFQEKLLPIGKLKTRIAQLKNVPKAATIGYSRKGIADKDMKIAVLAIGYADGYDRRFGNGVGEVLVAGQRAKIIGNICMDMCMIDVTHIDEINEGDEVEIYGPTISIIQQAKKIGTIA
ncbi:MAG TPA: bifunctional UDP-N-acetylmuramoyl-tripeptide:D-alanyl-D-alanine ligase/alanine racemase, partial [Chitinophagales bacterium]|nr:bifunctional UDP-N-acetylmuramoyl-tripeptide:D-alanyl-D-alanine ligase/alanine racemase [Chitinophagales bacterium]